MLSHFDPTFEPTGGGTHPGLPPRGSGIRTLWDPRLRPASAVRLADLGPQATSGVTMEELGRYTPDQPRRETVEIPVLPAPQRPWETEPSPAPAPVSVEHLAYVTPCGGDECPGWRVRHAGPGGRTASQILCPAHAERWYAWLRGEILRARWNASGLPASYARYRLATWSERTALHDGDRQNRRAIVDTVAQHVVAAGRGAVLLGPPGVGKTSLAVAILIELMSAGESGYYRSVVDSLAAMSPGYTARPGELAGDALLQVLKSVRTLVWDDIAKLKASAYTGRVVYDVIETRHAAGLRTIITANAASLDALGPALGDDSGAILDRLYDRERYGRVVLDGASRRRVAAPGAAGEA